LIIRNAFQASMEKFRGMIVFHFPFAILHFSLPIVCTAWLRTMGFEKNHDIWKYRKIIA